MVRIKVGLPPNSDPAAPFVLKAVAARLDGDIDTAEEWLNAAAGAFRALGVPNDSRLYRREARLVAWARDPNVGPIDQFILDSEDDPE